MKRSCLFLILLLAACLLLSGCGESNDDSSTESTAETQSEENILRIGVNGNCAPYNWTQDDDSFNAVKLSNSSLYINGYEISLMQSLCEALELIPHFVLVREGRLTEKLASGEIDCAVSCCHIPTEAKAEDGKQLAYSKPIFRDLPTAVVIAGKSLSAATTLEELNAVTCNALFNTVWYLEALDQIPMADIITAADSDEELLSDLLSGKCDLIVTNTTTARMYAQMNSTVALLSLKDEDNFRISTAYTDVGIVTTDANALSLLTQLDTALAAQNSNILSKLMDQSIANSLAYRQSNAAAAESEK